MTSRALLGGLAAAGLVIGVACPVGAEELRQGLNTPLILNLLALPMERPDTAFQESLRGGPGPPRAAGGWVELDDGSYRYGDSRLTVTIKNPCPEGKLHAPVALPGRRR